MAGRTYRYMTKQPMYPFGFGLSYTRFNYSTGGLDRLEANRGEPLTVEVSIKNTGTIAGDEVVQLYVSDPDAANGAPISSLRGFERVRLEAGESRTVSFTIDDEVLEMADAQGKFAVEPGDYRITVGGSSPGTRSLELGAPKPAEYVLTVK